MDRTPRYPHLDSGDLQGRSDVADDRLPVLPRANGSRQEKPPRFLVTILTVGVVAYSLSVLGFVATTGDIGLRCVFGYRLKEDVPSDFRWQSAPPAAGKGLPSGYSWSAEPPQRNDVLVRIGDQKIQHYTDYIKALSRIAHRVGDSVEVRWETTDGLKKVGRVQVRRRPLWTYLASLIWFLQELVIFAVGARVFWKRPRDDSARLFFWLCVVTVGAFMGGYHWTEIVTYPPLIYLFAMFAIFVPVVSLHFYLVFPRPNPIFEAHRHRVLLILYGVPTVILGALWASMLWSRTLRDWGGEAGEIALRDRALAVVQFLALGYVGLAAVIFGLCIACLAYSFRTARTRAERSQVWWILTASVLATGPIGYLLWQASIEPARLGLPSSVWPMFFVSLLYTLAYAMSITRYRLVQAEAIFNRSVSYFLVSVSAGLLYSGVLVAGTMLIGETLLSNPTTTGALVAGLTSFVILILSEAARHSFQKAIDRRFFREKSKFDQAMRKMSLAVESLVDRSTLGRQLLEAASEVLRLEWGALYLIEGVGGPLSLVACLGPEPDESVLTEGNPLVQRLREVATVRVPPGMNLNPSFDPATDAMIALGGEVAVALGGGEAEPVPAGLLVLGPKRSGMPYEDEEVAFLGALASVAGLALHSAGIQRTLETLNRDLHDKVEKIAEQQRRILILQDQLTDLGEGPRPAPEAEEPGAFERIKGSSRAVRQMVSVARKVAASPSAVLILGESGTGKELLAQAIHAASPRRTGPFVTVHCAALSPTLLESELFGHVRGAFTDAHRDRVGRFQQADGGTLFLDEIGDVSPEVQTKLLRVLQEMSFERVGSSQSIAVDVRILAATNQDLEALIRAGRFRLDLYYRLNVIPIRTPPLRERPEDIFELAVHFLAVHARRVGKSVTHLDDGAIDALVRYSWPGNIRQLENVIQSAVVLADGPAVTRDDLPSEVHRPSPPSPAPSRRRGRPPVPVASTASSVPAPPPSPLPWADPPLPNDEPDDEEALAFERRRLLDALEGARGNKSEAARLLGMPRSTFFSKLKKHGLA